MEAQIKYTCIALFVVILTVAALNGVESAGECGKSSPDREAFKLAPCAMAAQDPNAQVSSQCCAQVKRIGQNPSCLCAVMLSNTAKSSGIKPEIAITIPKRCNIADRPVGYQCGGILSPLFNILHIHIINLIPFTHKPLFMLFRSLHIALKQVVTYKQKLVNSLISYASSKYVTCLLCNIYPGI